MNSNVNMPSPDFFKLLVSLEEHKVRYVLIGGIALILNGGGITTVDIDLSIIHDRSNLNALAAALNEFDPRLRNGIPIELDERAFGGGFATYFTSVGVVQVINRLHGFKSFDELEAESNLMTIKGVPIRIASLAALEKMKDGTGRPKDQIHLDIIRQLRKRIED